MDDASHFWSHQIIGFETLFLQLPPHGIYIVEDIQTSFLRNEEGNSYADHSESFWSYISRLQAALACGQNHGPELMAKEAEIVSEIDTILLSRETVAIIKREAPWEVESEIANKKRRQARRAKAKELAAQ